MESLFITLQQENQVTHNNVSSYLLKLYIIIIISVSTYAAIDRTSIKNHFNFINTQ